VPPREIGKASRSREKKEKADARDKFRGSKENKFRGVTTNAFRVLSDH
jgi:hypothetical protein